MADPVRKYDDPAVGQDPFNPAPPIAGGPLGPDPLVTDTKRGDTYIDNRSAVKGTSGNGLLIGAVVIVLAAVAFYVFGPGARNSAPPAEQPAATAPATETPPAATAPADQMAPKAEAPATTAPATAEPAAPAPAEVKPAEPAPAPAQ